MKKALFALFFCLPLLSQAQLPSIQEELLAKVDSAVTQAPTFQQNRLERINAFQVQLLQANAADQYFYIYSGLQKAYEGYNADSSMVYVKKIQQLAKSTGNKEWKIDALLDEASICTSFGKIRDAENIINKLSVENLTVNQKVEYYRIMFLHENNQLSITKERSLHDYHQEQMYIICDSACAITPPTHILYMFFKMQLAHHHGHFAEIEAKAEQFVKGLDDTYIYKGLYTGFLSVVFNDENKPEKALEYRVRAALADLVMANHDQGSLLELAKEVFYLGYKDYGFRWANFCKSWASDSGTNVIGITAQTYLDEMQAEFMEEDRAQNKKLKILLSAFTILSLLALFLLTFEIYQFRKLKGSYKKLHQLNEQLRISQLSEAQKNELLNQSNDKLKKANDVIHVQNEELKNANQMREEFIASVFALGSSFISRLEEYRKRVNRQLKTGQIDLAYKQTDSNAIETSCIKIFYTQFDRIYLKMYPTFVEDFNKLLRPEEQIQLKDGELLNTELRIYALIRLSITDPNQIAGFLHCSTNTVYNTRLRVRSKGLVDKNKFDDEVKNMRK